MKNFKILFAFAFSLLFFYSKAGIEPVLSGKRQGTQIAVDSVVIVTDDKYSCILSGPCSPVFKTPILKNAVLLGIDHDNTQCHEQFTFSVTLKLTKTPLKNPGSLEYDTITLSLEWNGSAGITSKDKSIFNTEGYIKIESKILSYTSSLPSNAVPPNLYIENLLYKERYYALNYATNTSLNSITSPQADELTVSWNIIPGAEEYDLEWQYVDDFGDFDGSTISYKSASSISVDFRFNATRVTVKGTSHTLKNLYQHGYLLFRVRFVGKDTSIYQQRMESRWSSHSFGSTVNNFGSDDVDIYTLTTNHEDTLNWQWTSSFAEEGKSKTVISYFDGSLRSRQMVTYTNTDELTIVAESFYDHAGRKVVDALPVPTSEEVIKFYRNFNLSASTHKTYSWKDFDTSATVGACGNNLTGMDTSSGSSRYYSHNNSDKSLYQAYVPDAKLFPFVQVEFMPDNTGRVRQQSGVGFDHRMGSGHETKYFYGKPTQQELDMLFGIEVGDFNRYKKNMVVDPNGSISVSYLSPAGKVIATALAGENPSNLQSLPADTARKRIVEEMVYSLPVVDTTNLSMSITHDLLVTSSAQVDFDYRIYNNPLELGCTQSNICYDCIYDLKFSVTDICGNLLHDTTFIGIHPFDTICVNDSFTHSFSLALDKGQYRVYKELSINLESLSYYEEVYLRNQGCGLSLEEIYDSLENEIDYAECDISCDACLTQLGTLSNYKSGRFADLDTNGLSKDSLEDQFEDEYNFYVQECKKPCDTISECQIDYHRLLQDVTPGGQYALFSYVLSSNEFVTTDNLSLLDSTNDFPNYKGIASDWRNDSLVYFNSEGDTAYIWYDSTWTKPNNLPDSVFVESWDPAWVHTLVKLHPEYCYYQWCILNEASNKFDYRMRSKDSYSAALSDSLLDPLDIDPTSFPNSIEDPFFKTGGIGDDFQTQMISAFNAYFSYNSSDYTAWEAAAMNTSCSQKKTEAEIITCLGSNPFGSGSTEVKNQQWKNFRSYYLSEKQRFKDSVRSIYAYDNDCANCNIGHNDQPLYSTSCTTNFTNDSFANKQKQFPSFKESTSVNRDSGTVEQIIDKAKVKADSELEYNCAKQCESYAHNWMVSLKNCDGFSGDSAALRDSLIKICKLGCDEYNPYGSRNVSPSNSALVTKQNFKEVLAYFFPTNKICNEGLIPFPYDYNHDYASADSVPMDDCFKSIIEGALLDTGCTISDEGLTIVSLFNDLAENSLFVTPTAIDIQPNVTGGTWTDFTTHLMSYTSGDEDSLNKYYTYLSGTDLKIVIKSRNNGVWDSCITTLKLPTSDYQHTTGFYDSIAEVILMEADNCGEGSSGNFKLLINVYREETPYSYYLEGYTICYPICAGEGTLESRVAQYINNQYCKDFSEYDARNFLDVYCGKPNSVAYIPRDLSCKPACITCDKLNNAHNSFWNDYDDVYNESDTVQFDTNFVSTYTNYVNKYLGVNHDYFAYSELKIMCDSFYNDTTAQYYNYTSYRKLANNCSSLSQGKKDTLLTMLSLCDNPPAAPDTLSCDSMLRLQAYDLAKALYSEQMDTLRGNFRKQYIRKCMNVTGLESFTMAYDLKQYHYTLYYYDQADNLIKTVPPAGVRLITHADTLALVKSNRTNKVAANYYNTPHHTLVTNYKYNTLNAVYEQSTPDGGTTDFFYDRLGRLAISQNEKQNGAADKLYSYTNYDALGRITEVGETKHTTTMDDTTCRTPALLASWHSSSIWVKQVTKTYYDIKKGGSADAQFTYGQQYLRNRVSYITFDEDGMGDYDYASIYNYDIHGNVKELVHDYAPLQPLAYNYFKMQYEYDLISGNVNKVSYQPGKEDQFFHEYIYDADNRIRQVYTSRDGLIKDNDAEYFYYQHGPLARTEVGELKVQGMDFAYTIHGWLKGVNSGSLDSSRDIGKDGWWDMGNNRRYIPKDEYGFTLGYYQGDYYDIGQKTTAQHFEINVSGGFNSASPSLYNGNIRHMVTAIGKFMEGGSAPMGYAYNYDHLNRLASMNAYDSVNMAGNAWYTSATAMRQYHNRFTYDANGNILSQVRRGAESINEALDSLLYKYYPGTNRLSHVYDSVADGNYSDDIDDQDSLNYRYDAIGNLIYDAAEEIDSIQWNVYGKITRIVRATSSTKPSLAFAYGPDGNRLSKTVTYPNDSTSRSFIEHYVRDAQGNIMATYGSTSPYFEPIDTSYDKIITKLIDSMGLASFSQFIQTRFAQNDSFYAKLLPYIPDSAFIDSFELGELLSCAGDNIYSQLYSCCGNCGDYPNRQLMWEILDSMAAHGYSMTDELLACKPELVFEAVLLDKDTSFLREMGRTAYSNLYSYFLSQGYKHINTTSGDTLGFLIEDVPRTQLVNYLSYGLHPILGMSYADYLDAVSDAVSDLYATMSAMHTMLGKYLNPCSFMECIGRCMKTPNGNFSSANSPSNCSNLLSQYTEAWYDKYIDGWDNEPDIASYRGSLATITTGQGEDIIDCSPAAMMVAMMNYNFSAFEYQFGGGLYMGDFVPYFVKKYPHPSAYSDYIYYFTHVVPFEELAGELEINAEGVTGGNGYNDFLDGLKNYWYSIDESERLDLLTNYLNDCAYKKCIIKTGIQSHSYNAYSLKEYIQTRIPLRDFVHSRQQLCDGDSYSNMFVKTLTDRAAYSTFYSCGTRITEFGYDKYINDSLISQLADGPDLISVLAGCDSVKLLQAAGKHNVRLLLNKINARTPQGSTFISSACSTFNLTYPKPFVLTCVEYLAQTVPLDVLLQHIRNNYAYYVADIGTYTDSQQIQMLSRYYPACDFKSCTWPKVDDGTLDFDSTNLIAQTRDKYWPYLTRELYNCNPDTFTRHAAYTRPYIISEVFENWHYPLDSFMHHVQAYYDSNVRNRIDVDTMKKVQYLWVNEWHLYGSSRLGVLEAQKDTVQGVVRSYKHRVGNDTISSNYFAIDTLKYYKFGVDSTHYLHKGRRKYEGTNHLGNVLVAFTDKRIQVCTNDTIHYYRADVVNAFDYYPFGAPMPKRGWSPNMCANGVQVITIELDTNTQCFSLTLGSNSGEYTGEFCISGAGYANNIVATFEEGLDSVVSYYNHITGFQASRKGNKITIEANLCIAEHINDVATSTPNPAHILSLNNTKTYRYDDNYRFGFNGKENDNEVKGSGNQQDYGMRIHDTRLGRFLSVDPITKDYPWYTPYQFAGNIPISCIDIDGLEPWPSTRGLLKQTKTGRAILWVNDAAANFASSFVTAGSIIGLPIANQVSVSWNEGIHEGGAYDRNNRLTKKNVYMLNENWQVVPLPGAESGMTPTPEAGARMLKSTVDVVATPFSWGATAIEKGGFFVFKLAAKQPVKAGIDFVLNDGKKTTPHSTPSTPTTHNVTGDGVRLRGEGNKDGSILGLLYKNEGVNPTGNVKDDWSEVSTSDGRKGWVSSQYLTPKPGDVNSSQNE